MKPKKSFWGEGLYVEDDTGVHLLGTQCKECGHKMFPHANICHNCFSENLDTFQLPQKGILHSWTITHVPVGKFPAPHYLGVIDFPKDKIRVTAPLFPAESYVMGKTMQIESALLWEEDECEVWGYKFRQLEE